MQTQGVSSNDHIFSSHTEPSSLPRLEPQSAGTTKELLCCSVHMTITLRLSPHCLQRAVAQFPNVVFISLVARRITSKPIWESAQQQAAPLLLEIHTQHNAADYDFHSAARPTCSPDSHHKGAVLVHSYPSAAGKKTVMQ